MLLDDFGSDDFEDMVDEVEEHIEVDECSDDDEDIAFISTGGNSGDDDLFDAMVGKLEEIIMDDEFNHQVNSFMRQYCTHFERGDEQKLEYMEIFQQHTKLVEDHIERGLSAALPNFQMETFLEMLEARQDEVSEDVMDLLLEMSDFELFKDSMLAYKEQCVEKSGDSALTLCLDVRPTVIHSDEMEDGEERLDLMDALNIAPLSPGAKGGLAAADGPPAFEVIPNIANRSA